MMGDAVNAANGGIFRGLGRQKLALWLNVLGFWVLAVPIGSILTFVVGIGVFGLWWGMVIGIYLSSVLGLWHLRRVDWDHEARKTVRRLSTVTSTRLSIAQRTSTVSEHTSDERVVE